MQVAVPSAIWAQFPRVALLQLSVCIQQDTSRLGSSTPLTRRGKGTGVEVVVIVASFSLGNGKVLLSGTSRSLLHTTLRDTACTWPTEGATSLRTAAGVVPEEAGPKEAAGPPEATVPQEDAFLKRCRAARGL